MWTPFLRKRGFHMSSRIRTHLNKMELLRGRTELSSRWQEQCLTNTRRQDILGRSRGKIVSCHKPNLLAQDSRCHILDKHLQSKFAPKSHEGSLLGYRSNSHTYRVYNNFTQKVEEMVDVKFDESNGLQVE